ncbi:MocR-like pyridoxine biosynthesis transcription factor PdxR [Gemmobacter serpentinus]|uniref:MocR-like pyridoxine biosynthesis transcription factor PdxR n=1 Tax=Gemmobacter serpentinus TaxID=2652247 RepID=UPI00124DFE49|nr:PLP-dependent aminotransferase family protein [Gemmobacter serpentinus]
MQTNLPANLPDWSALIPVLPSDGPRARAVYAALRGLIEAGRLPPGAKLPPSRDLAARLAIARGAVVAGYEMLLADGFAEARVGAGTYVAGAVPRLGLAPSPPPAGDFQPKDLPGDLGLAQPDPQSLEAFRVLVNSHLAKPHPGLFHYADPRGDAGLRGEVAAYLRVARGLRLHPDQIVMTAGTQGALDLIARAVLAPGDEVWMEEPGYPSGKAAFAAQTLVPVPVDGEGLDVAAGRLRAPRARAAYVTPSHQFPLGVTMSMRRRLALLDWALEAGAWIIEDDYDSEFRYAGAPLAALQGMDGAGRVIYVGTFSKALMPGLRMGYLVLPEPLIAPVLALRMRSDRAPSGLIEPAMAEFLSGGAFAAHLRRARKRCRTARDALVAVLQEAGAALTAPDQGLHLTLPLPQDCDDRALTARLRAGGLGVRALSTMFLDQPRPGLVIGFSGHPPDQLQAAARGGVVPLAAALGSIRAVDMASCPPNLLEP